MTGDQAETTLKAPPLGFTKVTFIADDGSAPLTQWKVTKQTPAAGSSVDPSTEIILTVHNPASGNQGKG
jgi:beta-lactam-binding protein with PASTA domain